jgi:uncharacterized protein YciI
MPPKKMIKDRILFTLALFLIFPLLHAQTINPQYDKTLSDSLGSDEYGMKMYVLVILKSGPVKLNDKTQTDSLFAGHLQNIHCLANLGKLVLAGPLEENEKGYRGIFILNTATLEEAGSILKTDPAIRAKVLDAELYQWYGPAALPMYMPLSEKTGKMRF